MECFLQPGSPLFRAVRRKYSGNTIFSRIDLNSYDIFIEEVDYDDVYPAMIGGVQTYGDSVRIKKDEKDVGGLYQKSKKKCSLTWTMSITVIVVFL